MITPGRSLAAALALTVAMLLAACGTTTKSAHVGATLQSGGLTVTVDRLDPRPPIPRHDVTGLSRPYPGNRLIAAHVHVCTNIGPAIGSWDFSVGFNGDGHSMVNNVETNYPQRFDSLDTGCSVGWIVFQVPLASRPSSINFKFDDTGSAAGPYGGRPEKHVRFSWVIT